MKILFINTNPLMKDGITNVILNTIKTLGKNFEFHLLSTKKSKQDVILDFEELGVKVHYLSRSFKHPIKYVKSLKALIKSNKFDIVHVHGNSATMVLEMFAAKKGGCKVRIAHSHNTSCKYKLVHYLFKPLFYRYCTNRFACGINAGKWLYGKKTFTVINNGIDTEKFKFNQHYREQIREDYSLKENNKILCHIGVFTEAKNHDFLIDIFYELVKIDDSYRLFLVGEGALLPKIKEKVENFNLEKYVIFVGITNEVEKYLSASDIFIMPSLNEGLPLSLVEAQANGLHCIISDNITKEVNLTGLVKFVSLNDDFKKWVGEIENCDVKNRQETSKRAIQNIQENGYDTKSASNELVKYYKEF